MKKPKGSIQLLRMDEARMKALFETMRKGDPRCRFQIDDRIYKARNLEENELTPIGTHGSVVGAMYDESLPGEDKEVYWIFWDGNPMAVTMGGARLEKLAEPPRKRNPGFVPFKIK